MENKFMHHAEIDQRYRFSMVGSFEQLPHSTIADVVINHDMANGVTDPNLLKWFDEEYLIKRAAIFGLSRTDGPIHRIKTPTSII